jgi:hypothetical protein
MDFVPTWKPLQVGLLPRTIFDAGLRFTSCSWFVQSKISLIAETSGNLEDRSAAQPQPKNGRRKRKFNHEAHEEHEVRKI